MSNKNIIVIPCYNEATRLPLTSYRSFLTQSNKTHILFANDGSKDDTLIVLNNLASEFPDQVSVYNLKTNSGKAQAVREAILFCFGNFKDFNTIGYLDADLSTSLEEYITISENINETVVCAFGSRILKIDNHIDRKKYRFLIGRFVATMISNQLDISIYDSQCGCKVFSSTVAQTLFKEKFISKWLFDVEIFHRLISIYSHKGMKNICREIPLKSWIDVDESKVSMLYFFKMWKDLYTIRKRYK
ncbi:glycosyl transferase, family 2 [unidentified eubacterium SCB49]|nr:glycosyl transferase, family 2 [unidentified eubacterium SCB49]